MGKRLGWPTINLAPENDLVPFDGVYASRVYFPSFPATFDAVTNIGTRPTVYENYQRVVESHILDFNADVYGESVELRFYKRLREERIVPQCDGAVGPDRARRRDRARRVRCAGGDRDTHSRRDLSGSRQQRGDRREWPTTRS